MKNVPTRQPQNLENTEVFSAKLTAHRSLSPRAFFIFMTVITVFSFLTGLYFYSLGAWPVFGFFGLDVLAIYYAFRLNYREGETYETVELTHERLTIRRFTASGQENIWSFNPYWIKLRLEERRGKAPLLSIQSHGENLTFGNFLIPDEKADFAKALSHALKSCQAQP